MILSLRSIFPTLRRAGAAASVGALLVIAAPAAQATTVLKVGIAEMTQTSEWVVRARVLATAYVDVPGDNGGVFTDVTLAVDEVYRGKDVPKTVVMRLMGGVGKNGLALKVPGMPRFKVGDEAVLFLEKTAIGHVPCGLEQGVWRVFKGPMGYEVVQQTVLDLHLMERDPKGALVPAAHGTAHQSKLLAQLIAEIKKVPAAP